MNEENLKPFEKGQSGNPKGRPKGSRNVSTVLKGMLDEIAPGEIVNAKFVKEFCKGRKRVTVADATAARILSEALVKGESWAMKELMDRTEGKAVATVDVGNKDGEPFKQEVEVIFTNDGNG